MIVFPRYSFEVKQYLVKAKVHYVVPYTTSKATVCTWTTHMDDGHACKSDILAVEVRLRVSKG